LVILFTQRGRAAPVRVCCNRGCAAGFHPSSRSRRSRI